MAKTRRNYKRKHGTRKTLIGESVKGIKRILKPRMKSEFEKMDKTAITKGVTGLQKKTRGLFSMFGLNKNNIANSFGMNKSRRGKRVSFIII